MFLLKDLPNEETLEAFAKRYPELDASALTSCAILLRSGSDLLAGFERYLNKHDLSQGRFLTLIVMNRTPDEAANPSTLADQVGVTRATMTGLLDGLERKKLVRRLAHDNDRRMVRVELTEAGRRTLDTLLPDYYRQINTVMANLSERERRLLAELIDKVNRGIRAMG